MTDRRSWLTLVLALVILAVVPSAPAAQTRFVFANESPYDTLDPHAAFDVGRVAVRLNLYDGLYRWVDNPPIEINIPEAKSKDDSVFRSASTSVSDLNIPKRAAKEFSKASQQMEQQQWDRAAASLGIEAEKRAFSPHLTLALGDRSSAWSR